MEIRNLKTFAAVAARLSFHRAAESLNYAQSTVSAQILALEDELGVKLFDRLGQRIILTEAGERLLNYARKMIELEEEARSETSGDAQGMGSLTIRVPESYGVCRLPQAVLAFRRRRPKTALRFITCSHDGLAMDLRKGVTDLAFLLADSIQAADLEVEALGIEPLALVAGPDDPLAGLHRVRTGDLAGRTLLLSSSDCSYRRTFLRTLSEAGVEPGEVMEFNSVAAVKSFAALGLGLTIIPKIAVQTEVAAGRLKILDWEEELETALLMVRLAGKWLSPAMTDFMAAAREEVS